MYSVCVGVCNANGPYVIVNSGATAVTYMRGLEVCAGNHIYRCSKNLRKHSFGFKSLIIVILCYPDDSVDMLLIYFSVNTWRHRCFYILAKL